MSNSLPADSDGQLLIGRVADTTEHRDRIAIDNSIARLLLEYLGAGSVTLYGLVEDGSVTRMVRRASVRKDEAQSVVDSVSDLKSLPTSSDDVAWQECVSRREWVGAMRANDAHVSLFPIEDGNTIVGMLEVLADQPMASRDVALVRGILRILKNQLALLDYGERDTLTGLLNRKTFETRVHHLAASLRQGSGTAPPLAGGSSWLGLLDIDHFKAINDQYGHLFGDEILLLVSQLMKQTFRGADELFRFGGEEFIILLQQADEAGARIAFERLRATVEARRFPQSCNVTVSVGYTRVGPQDVPTTCVERADAALYFAKRHGRNNVRQHEKLVESGELSGDPKEGEIELF